MSNLKPGPFCGGAINRRTGFGGLNFFNCAKCGATISFDNDYYNTHKDKAVHAWNTRTKPEKYHLQQGNRQLRELLRLAMEDMKHCVSDTGCEVCDNKTCKGFDDCEHYFTWQHADKLKELEVKA